MDKLTKEQRHHCMSAIKGKNTKPELNSLLKTTANTTESIVIYPKNSQAILLQKNAIVS